MTPSPLKVLPRAKQKVRPRAGMIEAMTDDQIAQAFAYDGPISVGASPSLDTSHDR